MSTHIFLILVDLTNKTALIFIGVLIVFTG